MKQVQTSIRLDPGQKETLEAIAKKNGDLDTAKLVRWAIEQIIAYAERNGGRILLPIDFGERIVFVEEVKKKRPHSSMGSTAEPGEVEGGHRSNENAGSVAQGRPRARSTGPGTRKTVAESKKGEAGEK